MKKGQAMRVVLPEPTANAEMPAAGKGDGKGGKGRKMGQGSEPILIANKRRRR